MVTRTDTYYAVMVRRPGETEPVWSPDRHKRRIAATNQAKAALKDQPVDTEALVYIRTFDAYVFTAVTRYRKTEEGIVASPFLPSPDGSVVVYVRSGQLDTAKVWMLSDHTGEHTMGTATVRSKWRVNSYVGTHMFSVRATLTGKEHEGKTYFGKTFGPGMALRLKPMKGKGRA